MTRIRPFRVLTLRRARKRRRARLAAAAAASYERKKRELCEAYVNAPTYHEARVLAGYLLEIEVEEQRKEIA